MLEAKHPVGQAQCAIITKDNENLATNSPKITRKYQLSNLFVVVNAFE